jgi:hypothetical protein
MPNSPKISTIKRGVDARVGEIRRGLAHWIGDTTTSADPIPVSIALLETAIDRYLDTHDEPDARDLIENVAPRRTASPVLVSAGDGCPKRLETFN